MMDKLIYYYRVVHLQVGSTYVMALALLAFAVEMILFLLSKGGCAVSASKGDTDADAGKWISDVSELRLLILQGILWIATLSPIGIILAKIFLGGEPNNPLMFAIIPAVACTAYGVVTIYKYREKPVTLILAAILIILAAGQVSGFVRPPISLDQYAREDEIAQIEAVVNDQMYASSTEDDDANDDQAVEPEIVLIAPLEIASRLKEYRDDFCIYIYDETVPEPRQMNGGPVGINMGADIMICPAEDTAENVQMYLYGYEYLLQTEHYTVMRIPKE